MAERIPLSVADARDCGVFPSSHLNFRSRPWDPCLRKPVASEVKAGDGGPLRMLVVVASSLRRCMESVMGT